MGDIDAFLEHFLSREEDSDRSLSDYEKSILTFCRGSGDEEEDPEDDDDDDDEQIGDAKNPSSNKPADKFGGIRLYARFHSFYENKTKGSESLEEIHLELLEKLNDFSLVYIRSGD